LAALDLKTDVEQLFDCLIVKNRQAMQSMAKSMDWSLEDNVFNGLFVCATLTGPRGGHTHFYKQERKHLTTTGRRLSRTRLFLWGSFQGN